MPPREDKQTRTVSGAAAFERMRAMYDDSYMEDDEGLGYLNREPRRRLRWTGDPYEDYPPDDGDETMTCAERWSEYVWHINPDGVGARNPYTGEVWHEICRCHVCGTIGTDHNETGDFTLPNVTGDEHGTPICDECYGDRDD